MKRLKIAVLFGGCSPEYSVSLQSAAAVLQNMDSSQYEAVMVGISKTGDWYSYARLPEIFFSQNLTKPQKKGLVRFLR